MTSRCNKLFDINRYSVALGYNTFASTGTYNVIIGGDAGKNIGTSVQNVIIGNAANVSGASYSTVIGFGSIAKANKSIIIGPNIVNTTPNACVIGDSATPIYIQQHGRGSAIRFTKNSEKDAGGAGNSLTLTGADVCDGFLSINPNLTADVYFPTAAQIVAASIRPEVGCVIHGHFGAYYTGISATYFNIIVSDANVSYYDDGSSRLYDGDSAVYTVELTNVTAGSEACNIMLCMK